jgi:hypothetical protein
MGALTTRYEVGVLPLKAGEATEPSTPSVATITADSKPPKGAKK